MTKKQNIIEKIYKDMGPWAKSLYGIEYLSEVMNALKGIPFQTGGRVKMDIGGFPKGRSGFIKWALEKGFKHGQKHLNKVWDEATEGGKEVLESSFPKLMQRAENIFKPKKIVEKVTKIPTKYKKPPSSTKKEVPIFQNPAMQEALKHFQSMGTLGQKGIPSFDNLLAMNMRYTDKQIFDVLRQYGWKPKIVPKAKGGLIDKPLTGRSRDI